MSISVLISVYYKENPDFLVRALNSIVTQQLSPAEIVIVKDGKLTPELNRVIDEFVKSRPELFKVIEFDVNRGLGHALMIGVQQCSHEIIARMDTDDIARPERFKRQYEFLMKNPAIDVVGSNIEEFNVHPGDLKRFKINPKSHGALVTQIKLKSPFNHPSIMVRKSAILKAGNYNGDLLLFEDYSLFLRMWLSGAIFHNLQEVLLDFRVGDGIETIKRRSGKHYIEKESKFLKFAHQIGAFSKIDVLKYKVLKYPIRVLPARVVLIIYNLFLRNSR